MTRRLVASACGGANPTLDTLLLGCCFMLTIVKQDVDLEELEDQIRIARVRLGAALNLLERQNHEEYVLDEVACQIDEIASELSHLAAASRSSEP